MVLFVYKNSLLDVIEETGHDANNVYCLHGSLFKCISAVFVNRNCRDRCNVFNRQTETSTDVHIKRPLVLGLHEKLGSGGLSEAVHRE